MSCIAPNELPPPPPGKMGWPWTEAGKPLSERGPDGRPWPKISIVTPSYNQGQYIEETIRSVLLQDYPNLEYIVIDGGSTDGSVELVRKYSSQLAYWASEPDTGHGNALNKGFRRTTGDIMAWINSDDKYLPWTFSVVAEIFSTCKNVNWIMGCPSSWDSAGRQVEVTPTCRNLYDFLLGRYAWIQQESVFWRRSLWDKAGGRINEDYRFMVDGELWCRFFLHDDLWHVNCVLGGYRRHSSNRAVLSSREVTCEMERAISELRGKCPRHIRRKARFLQATWRLANVLKPIRVEAVIRNLCGGLYASADYRTLAFRDGGWIEGVQAFIRH
jgi:glycosyltransferase involved in cell wall biosynthesis